MTISGEDKANGGRRSPARDLAKSMIRFSWAAGLLGAQQVASWARPARRPADGVSSLEAVTWATQGQLGEMLQAAFQAGDDLQVDWTDLLAGSLTPARWSAVVSEMTERSMNAMRFASPGVGGALSRQELRNKLEVYWLVKGVRDKVGLPPPGQAFPLSPYVERAYRLGSYSALWLIEGLGHDYVALALEAHEAPSGLLRSEAVRALPENSLPMLHGGLGLACAEHVLERLTPTSSAAEARAAIERFVDLCRANSIDRYFDSAIEALGLDARCFFPDLVPVVGRGLVRLDDAVLHRYFWHGVGRALYFLPVNFIPGYGSLWQAVRMAERESPHDSARADALAGVSYAFTMVNMSHPAILERALRDHGPALRGTAFVDGAAAAIVMRQEITPGAVVLERLANHPPDERVAELWNETVRRPCRQALGLEPTPAGGLAMAEIYRRLPGSEAAR